MGRAALRYAVNETLVTAAFSGLFLLKMANLFPRDLDISAIMSQVDQLAQLLDEVASERYASVSGTCARSHADANNGQLRAHAAPHACQPAAQVQRGQGVAVIRSPDAAGCARQPLVRRQLPDKFARYGGIPG
jgi:hypothetical protein